MRTQKGSIGELLTTGVCVLAMTTVVLSYMGSVSLVNDKMCVNQLARKYILRMETVGYLTAPARTELLTELDQLGVTEVKLQGSTVSQVTYGNPITLIISGKLRGQYEFVEKRASTAKN